MRLIHGKQIPLRIFLLLAGTILACAQPAQRQVNPASSVLSPEVLPDHRVIFRIYAPKASSVEVTGDYVTPKGWRQPAS